MELDDQPHLTATISDGAPPGTDHETEDAMDVSDDYASQQAKLTSRAIAFGQELQMEFKSDPRREVQEKLKQIFALIAYTDARESTLAPLLEEKGRVEVAEELNSAILSTFASRSSFLLSVLDDPD